MVVSTAASSGGHRNSSQLLKSSVSHPRIRLIELMQDINFGRLEFIHILDADPLFDPALRVIREIKFGGDNGPRPELGSDDFVLKSQVKELFAALDQIRDGFIEVLGSVDNLGVQHE